MCISLWLILPCGALFALAPLLFANLWRVSAEGGVPPIMKVGPPPPKPEGFAPSNVRTEGGGLIPVGQFFPAARCLGCHRDTHAAWSQSLHRNAAREPFYRESADILLRTRGIEFTRHCESCHTPVALVSGALDSKAARQQAPFTPLDDEGVTCTVCHSITEARLDGTGSYTIRRPALLAREDGTPIFGDFTDEQILADVPAHKRAIMRPLLRQPEFCATCHKVDAPPSLNGYKRIRGFSAYDEWQQSGLSTEAVTPFYRKEKQVDCRGCHMPKVPSSDDRAAKEGRIASHQWLGANTAVPLFYGQARQAADTVEFLKNDLVGVDIFALRREAKGETVAPLEQGGANYAALHPGEELTADVVVRNRLIGHSFAPEVRDLYEIWVEFKATDAAGRTLFHSGFIKPDRTLDESAHTYKAILLDEASHPITRHQIWLTTAVAYNTALPAGRADVVRFRVRLPEQPGAAAAVNLEARVLYRRFNQEYTNYVLGRQRAQLELPAVMMDEARARVVTRKAAVVAQPPLPPERQAERWNDYGIGLLEQAQYGPAADAFRKAAALSPLDPDPLVSAAISEFRTERFGPERTQLEKASALLDAALKLKPALPRARFYRALILRAQGKADEATEEMAVLALEYPRDRQLQKELGLTLYALGRLAQARNAFEAILAVDPTDAGAYQYLGTLYAGEGRTADAERAHALYLQWRDDPLAAGISTRFFAANPQWDDERINAHTHGLNSPPRPVATGTQAASVK